MGLNQQLQLIHWNLIYMHHMHRTNRKAATNDMALAKNVEARSLSMVVLASLYYLCDSMEYSAVRDKLLSTREPEKDESALPRVNLIISHLANYYISQLMHCQQVLCK